MLEALLTQVYKMSSPLLNIFINIGGEKILIPLKDRAKLEVENREDGPAVLKLRLEKVEWRLGSSILKLECCGKTFYIGANTSNNQSWQFSIEPGQKIAISFSLITPPRLGNFLPSSIMFDAQFEKKRETPIPLAGTS